MIRAVGGSAGVRVAGMGFGFLVGVQLARGLGVEGYGVYGLAMSIIALATVPTEFGLPQLLTREVARAQVAQDWSLLRGVLQWSNRVVVRISLACIVVVPLLLVAVGRDLGAPLETTLLVGLALIPLVALASLRGATLRGLQQIVRGQLPDTLIRPAAFSALLFLAMFAADRLQPAGAVALGAGAAAIALIAASLLLRAQIPAGVATAPVRTAAQEWWSTAMPMALTEGMRVLQGHLALLMLGLLSTAAVVGLFRVATSVALLVAFPVALLNIVSAPVLARLHTQGDRSRLQRLLGWVALAMLAGTALLALPLIVAGEPLLALVFGGEFAPAAMPLAILCGGIVVNAVFGASATLLNMTGHHGRVTRAAATALLVLAAASPPAILLADATGAALASSFSLFVWQFLLWRDARRLLKLDSTPFSLLRNIEAP